MSIANLNRYGSIVDTPTPTASVETVTPEIAGEWLRKNTHNRSMKRWNLAGMVSDMKAGNWQFTGEPIKFSKDGTLIDGQHRLTAIAQSGIPQEMLIVRGLEMESQHTMDAGARRSATDALNLRGEKHAPILAAGIKQVILWRRDAGASGPDRSGKCMVTTPEILDYLDDHPECREYAREANRFKKRTELPAGIIFLLWTLFYEIDPSDAEDFFTRLASHSDFKGSPIYALDQALAKNARSEVKRKVSWKCAMAIKAWNKYRLGEPVTVLSFNPGGSRNEQFPEPI